MRKGGSRTQLPNTGNMIEKRDTPLTPVGGYKPDVMLPSGTLHHLPVAQALPQPLTLREVLSVFRRQWLAMAIIISITLGAGIFSIVTSNRIYESRTTILVEGTRMESGSDPVNMALMPMRPVDLATQIQVITSQVIRNKAYELAGIGDLGTRAMSVEDRADFFPAISVQPVGESSVLRISVESSNPRFAEEVARHLPQVYKNHVSGTRQGEVEKTKQNLEDRLVEERAALSKAEAALVEFKKNRPLLPFEGDGNIYSGRANVTDTNVQQAEADVIAAKKVITELEAKKDSVPPELVTPAKVANTGAIENQKNKIAELQAERNAALKRYMEDSREIQLIDSRIRDAEAYLKSIPKEIDTTSRTRHPFHLEYERRIDQAKADVKGAEARLNRLRAWRSESESDLKKYSSLQPEQTQLEQSIIDKRATIDWITRRLDDLIVRGSGREPVVVLQEEPTSAVVIRPRPVQYMALALMFGVFLAIGFALLKDSLDDRIASADEVFRLTGLPLLGEVFPLPRQFSHIGGKGLQGRFVERYRVLRFNLGLLLAKNPARSIIVTSAGRQEGKTEVAASLAYAAAEGESRRVVLIDADFRRPAAHKRFGLKEKPGLADILLGQASLEDVLQPGPVAGLQIIASGGEASNPVDLLALPQMIDLLARLEGMADLVVFDAPASTGLADAHVLSRVVDSVIYVAKTGRTRRTALRKGVEAFRQAGVRVLGVVEVAERSRR